MRVLPIERIERAVETIAWAPDPDPYPTPGEHPDAALLLSTKPARHQFHLLQLWALQGVVPVRRRMGKETALERGDEGPKPVSARDISF